MISFTKKETWVQVPKDTRFVNIGVDINGEVAFFRVIVIDDVYLLGFVIFDPEGNYISDTIVEDEDSVGAKFTYDNKNYTIQLMITDRSYEFIFSENWDFNNTCYLISWII